MFLVLLLLLLLLYTFVNRHHVINDFSVLTQPLNDMCMANVCMFTNFPKVVTVDCKLVEGCKVLLCKFHRIQAWKRRLACNRDKAELLKLLASILYT